MLGVAGSSVPAVYNLQNLTLAGNAQLQIVGPVILTLANGTTLNCDVGSAANPEWLTLRIASGGLSSNRNIVIHANVVAPGGTIALTGAATLNGTVKCDHLTINDHALLDDPNL